MTPDADGFIWMDDVPSAKPETLHHDFVSVPFTGRSSPVEKGQVLPLIVHRPGQNGPQTRQSGVEQAHQAFVENQIQKWGESSPYTVDWKALHAATELLVDGVISGDVGKVQEALSRHADSQTTVSVRDPYASATDSTAAYVTLPIGVAAAMRAREVAVASGDKLAGAPYKEIASMLLMHGNSPRVALGAHPGPEGGSAVSYTAQGLQLHGDTAGWDSVENRVVSVPLSVLNAIGAAAPLCLVDGAVPEQTTGYIWGEALPKIAERNNMDMIDTQFAAMDESIKRYRARRTAPVASSGFKIK